MRLEIWDFKKGGGGGGLGGKKNPFCGEIWTFSGTTVHNVGSSGLEIMLVKSHTPGKY